MATRDESPACPASLDAAMLSAMRLVAGRALAAEHGAGEAAEQACLVAAARYPSAPTSMIEEAKALVVPPQADRAYAGPRVANATPGRVELVGP